MGRLEGRVAFVTGAGRGVGRGVALAMAREGARIGTIDIDGGFADWIIAVSQVDLRN